MGIPGFDAAQAQYENAHPDDNLCPCQIQHQKDDSPGYDLATAKACDCKACHMEEEWWGARHFITEEFIENQIQLKFVIGLVGDMPNATKEIVSAAMAGLECVLQEVKA